MILAPQYIEIIVLGMGIGLVLGTTGAGGAILSVPLLSLFLNLNINQASPIGLLAVTTASAIAVALGLKQGIVRYKAALLMSVFGLCLSPIGFWLAQRIPNAPLVILFALLLLWVAFRMWSSTDYSDKIQTTVQLSTPLNTHNTFACERSSTSGKFIWTLPCARSLALTGSLAGLLSGLIGVGGGFVIVPSLKKNTNLNMRSIVATSLAVITIVTAGGVAIAAKHNLLDWNIGLPFTFGTILGMFAGQFLGKKLPSTLLSRTFSVLAIIASALMILKL